MVCPSCESVGEVPAPERCCFTFCSGDFDSLSLIADTAARIWSAVCKMIHNKFYMKKKKKISVIKAVYVSLDSDPYPCHYHPFITSMFGPIATGTYLTSF